MIHTLILALAAALYKEFGNACKIYTEEVTQGLEEPCFFITCIQPSVTLFLPGKYFCANRFCIQYLPGAENVREECNRVTERLFECLELLPVEEGLLRGKDMEPRTEDGILSFFISYDFYTLKNRDVEKMETMKNRISTKGQVEG